MSGGKRSKTKAKNIFAQLNAEDDAQAQEFSQLVSTEYVKVLKSMYG